MADAGFDQIVTLGIAALFGGLLLWLPIGFVVGRFVDGTAGIATGMLLFGLTGLGSGAWLAWHVHVETAVVTLPRTSCESVRRDADGAGDQVAAQHREVFDLRVPPSAEGVASAAPVRRLVTEPVAAPCADGAVTARLRYRLADLRAGRAEVRARREDDERQAPMLIGVFGAFGGFGVLGGLVLWLSSLRDRGRLRPPPAHGSMPPVAGWRQRLGLAFTVSGNLVLFGSFALALFGEEHLGVERGTRFMFNAVAASCVCWVLASWLRRRLTAEGLLIFVIVGGGFALAAASLRLMQGG